MDGGAIRERPVSRGLHLCELVITEERTRKVSLINCFGLLRSSVFPTPPKSFVAFAVLTDGFGGCELTLRIDRLDTFASVYEYTTRVWFDTRLTELRYVFRVTDLTLPVAGRYQVGLFADGELVAQTTLEVVE